MRSISIVVSIAVVINVAVACAQSSPASLSFDVYRAKVEPIFLKKRPTHARCIVCHEGTRTALRLLALPEGKKTWTMEQSRENFKAVSALVNLQDPMSSRILKHPLAQAAGGDDYHSGGSQFESQDDPDWKTIAAWVRGAK